MRSDAFLRSETHIDVYTQFCSDYPLSNVSSNINSLRDTAFFPYDEIERDLEMTFNPRKQTQDSPLLSIEHTCIRLLCETRFLGRIVQSNAVAFELLEKGRRELAALRAKV